MNTRRAWRSFLLLTWPFIVATTQGQDVRPKYLDQRLALARQSGYDAYAVSATEVSTSLRARQQWNQGARAEAIHLLDRWLERYPLSIVSNRMLAEFETTMAAEATEAGRRDTYAQSAAAHQDAYAGLLESITQSSNCGSFGDHCMVINIAEENAVIVAAGGKSKIRQAVVRSEGVPYDRIVVLDDSGAEHTFYFNISPFYRGL